VRVCVTGTLALTFSVVVVAAGHAQVSLPPQNPPMVAPGPPPALLLPSAPGFVSTYEIVRTLRSAGFDPLAPPLREGTIYVARATDYRGIPMRVVLDARTGAIRDANRIVPGPGNYTGPYGGVYSERAYGPYGPGPYGPDADDQGDAEPYGPGPYGPPGTARLPYGLPQDADVPAAPVAPRPPAGASITPLPRPRPPELASRKATDDAKPSAATATDTKPAAAVDPIPGPKPDIKPAPKPTVTTAAPVVPPASAAQAAPPPAAPAKPSKAPSTLTINN
jgi:hypothetical protein